MIFCPMIRISCLSQIQDVIYMPAVQIHQGGVLISENPKPHGDHLSLEVTKGQASNWYFLLYLD